MNIGMMFGLAFGLFMGNWLLSPLIVPGRTFTDGFFIGLIAAVLTLIFGLIFVRN